MSAAERVETAETVLERAARGHRGRELWAQLGLIGLSATFVEGIDALAQLSDHGIRVGIGGN